jgi:hypothetical protein
LPFLSKGQNADFLIIGNPAGARILDQYQMLVPADDPIRKMVWVPMQILAYNADLSDNINRAVKVRLNKKVYYLPAGDENDSDIRIFKNSKVLNDTIRINSKKVILYDHPLEKNIFDFSEGQVFIRIYQQSNQFCLFKPGIVTGYFWSSLKPASGWEILRKNSVKNFTMGKKTRESILRKFEVTNETLKNFIINFNEIYGDQVQSPRWRIENTPDSILAVFEGAEITHFKISTALLIREIDYLLLGTNFIIGQNENQLIIRKKSLR